MKILIPLLLSVLAYPCLGQNYMASNSVSGTGVGVTDEFKNSDIKLKTKGGSLNIRYQSVDDLKKPQVVLNAFELKMKAKKQTGYNVAATMVCMNGIQQSALDGKLKLKLVQSPQGASIFLTDAPLSLTPINLFYIPAAGNGTDQYKDFVYDLVVGPFDKFVPQESYGYSITFTMTQP